MLVVKIYGVGYVQHDFSYFKFEFSSALSYVHILVDRMKITLMQNQNLN